MMQSPWSHLCFWKQPLTHAPVSPSHKRAGSLSYAWIELFLRSVVGVLCRVNSHLFRSPQILFVAICSYIAYNSFHIVQQEVRQRPYDYDTSMEFFIGRLFRL